MIPILTFCTALLLIVALALYLDAKAGWKAAAYWQQECGEQVEIIVKLSPDAQKWRLARAARRHGNKAKSQAQSTLIAQTTAALRSRG